MASSLAGQRDGDRISEVLNGVQLPLSNAEFALEQFLMSNGQRLDTETRVLLAGVRDCIGRVVLTTRHLSEKREAGKAQVEHAA